MSTVLTVRKASFVRQMKNIPISAPGGLSYEIVWPICLSIILKNMLTTQNSFDFVHHIP